jgi:hypothetical protein
MTNTTTPDMTTAEGTEALLALYLEMFAEPDPAVRAPMVERVFAVDGRHVDPAADAQGRDEINDMVTAVHGQFPGFQIARSSGIDQHGDQLRFAWTLLAADGTPIVEGLDVAELSPDGLLQQVAGFWGPLPAA